MILPSLLH